MSNIKINPEEKRFLQVAKLFPNMVTLTGLCAGLSAMRWALDGRWELAVSLIIIAAVLDAMDGRLARILNATSNFGAQLDSLSDFINFGVAPAFILYKWHIHEIKGVGWAIVLLYAVCCAIRLARFNTELDEEDPPEWKGKFFVGVPSPAGALIALGPLVFTFAFRYGYPDIYNYFEFFVEPAFLCVYLAIIALLMASRTPTFSFKKMKIRREHASFLLVGAGFLAILLMTEFWVTLFVMGVLYYLTIPLSILSYYNHTRKNL